MYLDADAQDLFKQQDSGKKDLLVMLNSVTIHQARGGIYNLAC
jgi:hypothetical protein